MALVTAASLLRMEDVGPEAFEIPYGDKLGHFLFYAVAMFLALMALGEWLRGKMGFRRAAATAFAGLLAYGLLMEGLQWAMQAGRSAEWADVAANSLGLVAGLYSAKGAFHSLRGLKWPD